MPHQERAPVSGTGAKRPVSAPARPLPAGAWDTHAHVVGPFDRFPLHAARRLDPPLAPFEDYLEMLDAVGFARGVLVHSQVNGLDNGTTLDAVSRSGNRVVGIGVVDAASSADDLARLDRLGMRGLRFSNDGINPPAGSWYGSLTLDDLGALAPAMRRLGWHAQVHGRCAYLVARVEQWLASGLTIVFDHTGRPDVERGVGDRSFQAFLSLLREGPFFVKLTPGRLSSRYPDYGDVRPFFEALAKAAPDQLLFGSDWPFFGEDDAMPDAGRLVDLVDAWLPDAELRRKIFVANPERLFGGVRRAADDGGAGEAAPARACSD